MKRLVLVVFLLLAGGLAVFLATQESGDEGVLLGGASEVGEQSEEDAVVVGGQEDDKSGAATTNEEREAVATVSEAGQIRIRGRLLDGDGKPMAGIKLTVGPRQLRRGYFGMPSPGLSKGAKMTETGADGSFSVGWAAGQAGSVQLKKEQGFYWTGRPHFFLASDLDLDLGDLPLSRGASLSGTISSKQGGGVAAKLMIYSYLGQGGMRTIKTKADGSFMADGLPVGRVQISVNAKGHSNGSRSMQLLPGMQSNPLTVALPQGPEITGLVVDDLGKPVAGAQVNLQGGSTHEKPWYFQGHTNGKSDKNGRFKLSGSPSPTRVSASHKEHLGHFQKLKENQRHVELVLKRRGKLIGRVVSPSGEGLATSRFTIYRSDPSKRTGRRRSRSSSSYEYLNAGVSSGFPGFLNNRPYRRGSAVKEDGSFESKPQAAGQVWIEVTGMHRRLVQGPFVIQMGQKTDCGALCVQPMPIVTATVLDAAGKPVAGATVEVREPVVAAKAKAPKGQDLVLLLPGGRRVNANAGGKILASAQTDKKGQCALGGMEPGQYEISAKHKKHLASTPQSLTVRKKTATECELTLQAGGHLAVQVIGQDDKPVRYQGFRLLKAGKKVRDDGTDATGRGRLSPLAPGKYHVVCLASKTNSATPYWIGSSGKATEDGARVSCTIRVGEVTEISLRKPLQAALRGQVRGASGPQANASLILMPKSDPKKPHTNHWASARRTSADASGMFHYADLLPGSYELWIAPVGSKLPHYWPVEIHGRSEHKCDVSLQTSDVDVAVQCDGEAVAGSRVTLTRTDGGRVYFMSGINKQTILTAGADGVVRFTGVPNGSYTAKLSKTGYKGSLKDLAVGGSHHRFELKAEAMAELALKVHRGGSPVKGHIYVRVQTVDKDKKTKKRQTRHTYWNDRRKTLRNLAPGECEVSVRTYQKAEKKWGAWGRKHRIKLIGGKVMSLEIDLNG